jgi:transposase
VRRDGGRWQVAFCVQVDRAVRRPACPRDTVGVDVGITHLAVLSTGELVSNPRHLDTAGRRLRRLARRVSRRVGPDRRTGQQPSNRWRRAQAQLGRAHARVANLRRDGLHKLTTRLAATYGTVVVEDLNVAGMLRTGGWPGTSPTPGSPSCAGNWRTRPRGTAAGCTPPTAGIRPRRPARAAVR